MQSQIKERTRPRELAISPLCNWGQTLYGECRPFSYLSNIPFTLDNMNYYSPEQLIAAFSDPRFMHYSLSMTTVGLNGERVMRASKDYPSSFALLYWNAYDKYRPGSRVTNNRISPTDLVYSMQYLANYELHNDEIEITDNFTKERIYVYMKMDNLQPQPVMYVDATAMLDEGSARGLRAGL